MTFWMTTLPNEQCYTILDFWLDWLMWQYQCHSPINFPAFHKSSCGLKCCQLIWFLTFGSIVSCIHIFCSFNHRGILHSYLRFKNYSFHIFIVWAPPLSLEFFLWAWVMTQLFFPLPCMSAYCAQIKRSCTLFQCAGCKYDKVSGW